MEGLGNKQLRCNARPTIVPRTTCAALAAALFLVSLSFAGAQSPSPNSSPAATASPSQPQSTAAASASAASASLPTFEVVSIKPDKSDSDIFRIEFTPDGVSINGLTIHMLLRESLGVSDNQLTGEPAWLNSDRFNVEAKVSADDVPEFEAMKPKQRWAMLLPVFEDRFALKFHKETKDITQYTLVIAKGGPKMKEASPDNAYADGIKRPDGSPGGAGIMRIGPGVIVGQAIPVANLVRFLSFEFHSPVLDKTGLTGKYDVNLNWLPDESEGMMMRPLNGPAPPAGNPPPPPTTGPSIFTALEEQLGLKLEAHKEPGEVIVIDHIEQPSAN